MFEKIYLMNRKYAPQRNRKAGGFSIIELIITISLLVIVMAIAYPNFQRLAINGNLKTAARDLVADFQALRERAMAENTQFAITFDVSNNRYTCPGLPYGGKTPAGVSRDIRITQAAFGGGTTVTFLTRGTLSQAGNVVLTNSRGSTARITCNLSGRTYVQFTML